MGEGLDCLKYYSFAKNRHGCFAKSPIRRPFGWFRHESGLEKTAFSIVWTPDRLPDGLGYAGMKGGVIFSFRFFRVGCMTQGLDAGILVKGAMRHF